MKKLFLFGLLISAFQLSVTAQNLTLDSCQSKAKQNYPLVKQYGLIEETAQYNISNANKAYLPQLNLSAKATYQSDVTQIPASLGQILSQVSGHEVTFPSLSKDQYQAVLELSQVIWDGGIIGAQKKNIKASTEVEKQKLDVDLYALNERVNNLFFGIMLINEQLQLNKTLQTELATNYKKVEAYKANGVAQQSDLDAIKVEQINAQQKDTELSSARKTYLQMLTAFTGIPVDENTVLEKPALPNTLAVSENKRPELLLFNAQEKVLDTQRQAVNATNFPKIGLFAQGGYGRPGLNMFTSEFSTFYIGGIRLSWNISSLYSHKSNIEKIDAGKKSVEVQKETFLFNNNLQTQQQQNEVAKLKQTLKNDDEIITLRNNIKKAAEAKVENGTLTVTDMIREINAESMARQTKSLHEIQLYMAVYQLKNTVND